MFASPLPCPTSLVRSCVQTRLSRRLQALFGAYLRPGVPARLRRTAAACAARLAARAGGADAALAQALGAISRERASAVRCGSPEAPWPSRTVSCSLPYGLRGLVHTVMIGGAARVRWNTSCELKAQSFGLLTP